MSNKHQSGPSPASARPQDDERMNHVERDAPHRADDHTGMGSRQADTFDREASAQMMDPHRRRQFQDRWNESLLPSLPPKNGFHRCWVSTSHPVDTPQRRKRNGYNFVMLDDVKHEGWSAEANSVKDGVMAGAVMWREMVAMETTIENYEAYMREFHFEQPREQAQGIFDGLDALADDARSKGGKITLEEGMRDLRERVQNPRKDMFDLS